MAAVCVLTLSLALTAALGPAAAVVDPSAGIIDTGLATTPGELGEPPLEGLQHGNPLEEIALIGTPEPNVQGAAQLVHPLPVPPGRAGVQPELALTYDSSSGIGWVGIGWNLSIGEVSLDTRFGVPRYDRTRETETYVLDGEQLHPTAVREPFLPRVANREDFVRRVEDEFERIIRHGDAPTNYHWQVTDKRGTNRWYGGSPSGFDRATVLTDSNGNVFRWGLSYVEDVSKNVMRISYDKPTPQLGADASTTGVSLYPATIAYTGSVAGGEAKDDPAYLVRLLRRSGRKDVQVNATGGALDATAALLDRVEVWYGEPVASGARKYDKLVRSYSLEYDLDAPFGKSLLTAVHQRGRNPDAGPSATHTFQYFDEVTDGKGKYDGFTPPIEWNTQNDDIFREGDLPTVGTSALGSSVTIGGDGGAYIGFNPAVPSKTGSFGGSFMLAGSESDGLTELFDINGDGLPDKVFRTRNGVSYRLNTTDPSAPLSTQVTFGPVRSLEGVDSLSNETNFGFSLSAEAHLGVTAQVATGLSFAFGDRWFTDVNGDGLPDFVKDGQVFFNRVDADGIPSFVASPATTPIPLNTFTSGFTNAVGELPGIGDPLQRQRELAPLIDTVRRWSAPYDGTIEVKGTATLTPVDDGTGPYAGDGVVVMVQQAGTERWRHALPDPGDAATHDLTLTVSAGQALYFRVNAVDDGARDEVTWNPTITYTGIPGGDRDANGLPEATYVAGDDFTLAGIGEARTGLPLGGTLSVHAEIAQHGYLSDDVRVVARHYSWRTDTVEEEEIVLDGSRAAEEGDDYEPPEEPITAQLSATFDVDPPRLADPDNDIEGASDWVSLTVESDTPVDPNAVSVVPRARYTAFEPVDNVDLDPGAHPDVPLMVSTDLYPMASGGSGRLKAPAAPWVPGTTRDVKVTADITGQSEATGEVVLSVKTPAGLVDKKSFDVVSGAVPASPTLEFEAAAGVPHWVELAVQDVATGERLTSSTVTVTTEGDDGDEEIEGVQHARRWAPPQSLFPLGHRGWAVAGYNAGQSPAGAIHEEAFEIDTDQTAPDLSVDSVDNIGPDRAYPYAPLGNEPADGSTGLVPAWRLDRPSLSATATTMRSSRLGTDRLVGTAPVSSAGRPGLQRLGITGPGISVAFGLILGVTGGVSPSFGLRNLVDVNGDGIADVVTNAGTTYTLPRGGNDTVTPAGGLSGADVTGFDTQFAFGGGIGGSPVAFSSSSGGDGPTSQSTATSPGATSQPGAPATASGGHAAKKTRGFNIGLGLEVMGRWTNPVDDDVSDITENQSDLPALEPLRERALVDVNGDGLPDRVEVSNSLVKAYLNTGYGFSSSPIVWGGGALEGSKTLSGTISPGLGFQINSFEFGGGIAFTEAVTYSRYGWVDLDGDGVLDRLRKDGEQGGDIKVAWGNARSTATEVPYGAHFIGEVDLNEPDGSSDGAVQTGPQISQSRTTGLAGGLDFTISIGPICAVACYLIINPGAHVSGDVSRTQIQMTDVNGDGYPDSVRSRTDGKLEVRLNKRGRTNLLRQVRNPIGGSIALDYTRTGNTVEQPVSQWLLTDLSIDDGRPGDGADVQTSTFTYEGNAYDRLEKVHLGHSRIVERQHDSPAANGRPGAVLRTIEREYRNATLFHTGQLVLERVRNGDLGRTFYERTASWALAGVGGTTAPTSFPPVNDPGRTALLELALSPRVVQEQQRWFDADGDVQLTRTTYTYDALGNVVTIADINEDETAVDDTFTVITYSPCTDVLPDGSRNTWVSLPATVTVHAGLDATGAVVRKRDASVDLCVNGIATRIVEWITEADTAVTEFGLDVYGSHNSVTFPENGPAPGGASSNRYRVDYVYDEDRFTNIAQAADSHGVTARATYDPFSGRMASHTDPNGHVTTYTYDLNNRLSTIIAPKEAAAHAVGGPATVAFEYVPAAGSAHAYAVARHADVANGNPITTVAFVDGIGRVTQRKQDASVFVAAGEPAADVMVVEGAVEFDALGREVSVWYPITEPLVDDSGEPLLGVYNLASSEVDPTVHVYDTLDRVTDTTLPDGSTTKTVYDIERFTPGGPYLFAPVATDPLGKETQTFRDVRGLVHAHVERPLDVEAAGVAYNASTGTTGDLVTAYTYDALGRLVTVTDPEDATTTHSYDMLDRLTSVTTPNGGLVEREWSPAGSLLAEIDAERRARGEQVTYTYDRDRLVEIDYPGTDIDVTYTWDAAPIPDAAAMGITAPAAPGSSNQIGQIAEVTDGAMRRVFSYDEDGNTRAEHTTMFTRDHSPADPAATTHRTAWTFDSFGRITSLTYHDGEVLTYSYDAGGLLQTLTGDVPAPASDGPAPTGTTTDGAQRLTEAGTYVYIEAQQYDVFLRPAYRRTGGQTETLFTYDEERLWFTGQRTTAAAGREVQDLAYTRDLVGNVTREVNDLPSPTPSRPEGPSVHSYTYDPYYRTIGAIGRFTGPKDKDVRGYAYATDFAPNGRLLSKTQTAVTGAKNVDALHGSGSSGGPPRGGGQGGGNPRGGPTDDGDCDQPTNSGGGDTGQDTQLTYALADLEYSPDHPHQLTQAGARTYSYDLNGNLTGWVEECTHNRSTKRRVMAWDAANRMASISDSDVGNSATTYRYTAEGARAIERGPGGEYSFVNDVWTTENDGRAWKHVFVGSERVALRRWTPPKPTIVCRQPGDPTEDEDGNPIPDPCAGLRTCFAEDGTVVSCPEEPTIYFIHTDVRGSTRSVTDEYGVLFEHLEYVPGGRPWVRHGSTQARVPYRFGGGWHDATHELVSFGARWYEPREQQFLSTDPVLVDDPTAVVDNPTLLSAYSYAAHNLATLVDADGQNPTFTPKDNIFVPGIDDRPTPLSDRSKRLASITTALAFDFSDGRLVRFRLFGKALLDRRTDSTAGGGPANGGPNQPPPADTDSTSVDSLSGSDDASSSDDASLTTLSNASLSRSSSSSSLTDQAGAASASQSTRPDPGTDAGSVSGTPGTSRRGSTASTSSTDLGGLADVDLGKP